MKRIIAILVTVLIVGCQSVPQTTELENPRQVVEVKQGKEIEIITLDDKRLVMTYVTASEEVIVGYVTRIYKPSNSYVPTYRDDSKSGLDIVPFENIGEIVVKGKAYTFDGETAGEVAVGIGAGVGAAILCLVSIATICPYD